VPTVTETGVASMALESWFGIFSRRNLPPAVLERLRAEMAKAVQAPEVVARFEKGGGRMLRMSPAEAEEFVRRETATWTPLIREAGIAAE
jgi:tripartite-type tricarboxylate transporter receptor subunit TctC